MISINATLVVQIIHFLILVFILNRLMIQPILKMIGDRAEYIAKTKGEITDLELETERMKKEFVSEQSNARKVAFQERDRVKSDAFGIVDEYIRDSQEKVASIRDKADSDAEREIQKVQPLLRDEAVTLADDIILNVFGRRIEG